MLIIIELLLMAIIFAALYGIFVLIKSYIDGKSLERMKQMDMEAQRPGMKWRTRSTKPSKTK